MRLAARRVPRGLLGMVGLVLAVECGLAQAEPHFYGTEAWDWRIQGAAGDRVGPSGEVLLLGDSQLKFGLSALMLAEQLGRVAHTVAPGGCNPVGQYYLLKRALERGVRPAAVVVDFMPALLFSQPDFTQSRWADLLTTRDAADLAWTLRKPGVFVRVILNKLLPAVRDREEIRAAVRELVRGHWFDKQPQLHLFAWHHKQNQGNMVLPSPASVPSSADCRLWQDKLYPQAWLCRRMNLFFMRKFLALAAAHATPVYWVLFPTCPEMQSAFEAAGDDERYGQLVASLAGEWPNVVVLDARHSGYDATAFFDPIHLNRYGNAQMSADVGACLALRSQPGRQRWVELPRYDRERARAPLEDDTQSDVTMRQQLLEPQSRADKTRRQ